MKFYHKNLKFCDKLSDSFINEISDALKEATDPIVSSFCYNTPDAHLKYKICDLLQEQLAPYFVVHAGETIVERNKDTLLLNAYLEIISKPPFAEQDDMIHLLEKEDMLDMPQPVEVIHENKEVGMICPETGVYVDVWGGKYSVSTGMKCFEDLKKYLREIPKEKLDALPVYDKNWCPSVL